MTYSYSETTTFTVTHARHMAAKVAADLKRMQRLYGAPDDLWITRYENEIIAMLNAGYLGDVTYGFKRNGLWITPTLRYTASELSGATATDDDPGKIRPGADTMGATFYSFLTYSATWDELSSGQRERFKNGLPFQRTSADAPGIDGYLESDRTYSAGGRALNRTSVRTL
jgi:hypothetical protein